MDDVMCDVWRIYKQISSQLVQSAISVSPIICSQQSDEKFPLINILKSSRSVHVEIKAVNIFRVNGPSAVDIAV
jgi:hypothetical protein